MKRFLILGVVVVGAFTLVCTELDFLSANAQDYYVGGKCVQSGNCANCLVGIFLTPDPVACPNPPNLKCAVAKSNTAQATFAICVQDPDNTNGCMNGGILNPPIVCQDMSYWLCGCANAHGGCDTSGCPCEDDPDGQTTFRVSNVLCAEMPVVP